MIQWEEKSFDDLTKEDLYAVLRLRSEVFVVEQDCVYQDLDNKDFASRHLLGWEADRLVAYMRVLPLGVESHTEGSIGRIIVAGDYRGQGLGHELVDRGIAIYNRIVGPQYPIVIHAQSRLEKFYEQHGFVAATEPFMFEGLLHTIMRLEQ